MSSPIASEASDLDAATPAGGSPTTVLARKLRPRNFEAMVGQEHVVRALANALKQRRLHHAYLFTGTRGVGKTTVARILAKSLNCTGPDGRGDITAEPCGVCPACREIDEGRYVDYVELDAASNRGVDEMTQLLEQSVYKPVLGRFKVYLIDEVHMLSGHAFNAMLKTLEEPPDYLKFVLATTDPQKVPATVLSRCLQFNLRPMPPATIADYIAGALRAEGVAAEPGALRVIARAARGSMRDALSITDQAIAFGAGAVAEEPVRRMLGAVDRRHAVRIVDAVAAHDARAVVAAVDALRDLGLSAAGTLEETVALLQAMAVHQALGDEAARNTPGGDPDEAHVARLAQSLAADETHVLYSILLTGRDELGLAPDEHGALMMLLLRMLAFAPVGSPPARSAPAPARNAVTPAAAPAATSDAVAVPTSRHERVVAAGPVPAAANPSEKPAAPVASAPPMAGDRGACDRWVALVERMVGDARIGAMVRELAMQAECTGTSTEGETTVIRLRVERENLRAPALRDRLQAALSQTLQRPVRLDVEGGAALDSAAERQAAEKRRRQAEAERIIHDDPLVKALLAQYKTARIVPGSVRPI